MPATGFTHGPLSSAFMPSAAVRAKYTNYTKLLQIEQDILEKQSKEDRRVLEKDASKIRRQLNLTSASSTPQQPGTSLRRSKVASQSYVEDRAAMLELEFDRAFSKKNRIPLRKADRRYYSFGDRDSPSLLHARRIMTRMKNDWSIDSVRATSRGSRRSIRSGLRDHRSSISTASSVSHGALDSAKPTTPTYDQYIVYDHNPINVPKKTITDAQRNYKVKYANSANTSRGSGLAKRSAAVSLTSSNSRSQAQDTDCDGGYFFSPLVVKSVSLRKGTGRRAGLLSAVEGNRPIRQGTFTKERPDVLKLDEAFPVGSSNGSYDTTSESIIFDKQRDPTSNYKTTPSTQTKDAFVGPTYQTQRDSATTSKHCVSSKKGELLRKISRVSFNEDVVVANFYDSKSDDEEDYPDSEHDSLFTPPSGESVDDQLAVNNADGSWSQIVYGGIEQLKYGTPETSSSETLTEQIPVGREIESQVFTRRHVPCSSPVLQRKWLNQRADVNNVTKDKVGKARIPARKSTLSRPQERRPETLHLDTTDTEVEEAISKLSVGFKTSAGHELAYTGPQSSAIDKNVTKPKLPVSPFRRYTGNPRKSFYVNSPHVNNDKRVQANKTAKEERQLRLGTARPSTQAENQKSKLLMTVHSNGDGSRSDALLRHHVRTAQEDGTHPTALTE